VVLLAVLPSRLARLSRLFRLAGVRIRLQVQVQVRIGKAALVKVGNTARVTVRAVGTVVMIGMVILGGMELHELLMR
jgi:hypothetical protein